MGINSIELWFDVEIEWITTSGTWQGWGRWLWFDVEIEWITTSPTDRKAAAELWFDVEIEWITTVDENAHSDL